MHCSREAFGSLAEETEQQYKHCYWPVFSPTSSFSPANPRTWCHSHAFHGFRWIRHGLMNSWFFQICSRRRSGKKHLFSVIFSLLHVHQASSSIMRLSTTDTTSLSHPRCRHLAMGAWLFSLFCGHLLRISFTGAP